MSTADRAQSYANAFYEAAFERWLTTLDGAARSILANGTLLSRLQDARIDFDQRQAALLAQLPADADPLLRNLLSTLLQRGELAQLGGIAEALRARLRTVEQGPVPVEVTTATPLDDGQRQTLEARLAQQYGSALVYEYRVDPAILGGMIVRVGDKLIDGSVASRLAAMRQSLGVAAVGAE